MTFADVDAFLGSLGEVTRGVRWRNPTWSAGERPVAWQRPLRKRERARLEAEGARVPEGDILAVRLESLDEKEGLLSLGLPGFFTIPHFDGFAAVLVELRRARTLHVKRVLRSAWAAASAKLDPPRGRARARRP